MASPETIKQRQLIWAEYRARRTKQQAFINVNAKLGSILVPQSTIDFWYEQFDAGRKTLFDQGTKQEDITHAIQTLPNGEEVGDFEWINVISWFFRRTFPSQFCLCRKMARCTMRWLLLTDVLRFSFIKILLISPRLFSTTCFTVRRSKLILENNDCFL